MKISEAVQCKINQTWTNRADLCIAHAALTNSKRHACHPDLYPTHVRRGALNYLYDVNDKKFLDYICGLGTNIIGYTNKKVHASICDGSLLGLSPSFPTMTEVEAAEKFKACVTFVDLLRFLKTGSEACAAAVRIARAFTGRTDVFVEDYHGWHDEFTSLNSPATGVPSHPHVHKLPVDFTKIPRTAAAVIVEPVMTDAGDSRRKWLEALRSYCTAQGIVLIFDEIITGFRWPSWCVAQHWDIYPDLICFGKAISNGMPLSIVAGKKDIMSCEYFVSSTYAGEVASLKAMMGTIDFIRQKCKIEDLWERGERFQKRFNKLDKRIQLVGYPTRGVFEGPEARRALFFQEMFMGGILLGPSFFYNYLHPDYDDHFFSLAQDVVGRIKSRSCKLVGREPMQPYAKKVRSNGSTTVN